MDCVQGLGRESIWEYVADRAAVSNKKWLEWLYMDAMQGTLTAETGNIYMNGAEGIWDRMSM